MLRIIRLGFCLCLVIAASASVRAQAQNPGQAQAPEITIVVGREAVRFSALNDAPEWHLVVTSQQGEVVFDSGTFQGSALEWPLRNQQGEAVASGLYAYTLTTRTATDQTPRTQRGHVILDRPSSSDRIWVTSDRSASMGAAGTGVRLTVIGDSETTVGGAEIEATARNRDRASEGQVGEGRRKPTTTRAVTEEKQQDTSAVTASPNRIAKFAADGSTLVDSSVTESATGDIGIGTSAPGGVFDLQRSSTGDILQRLWNTGTGGAKLRYVAATGATSQLQLTDGLEWLSAIAGNNSIGLQFRVRDTGDANNEATLAAAARMTILRNGNVGIGTTSPQTKLSVENPFFGYGLTHTGGTFTGAPVTVGTYTSAAGGWLGTRSNHPLYFFTNNGGQQMTLGTNGNVGIGTTSPTSTSKLEIAAQDGLRITGFQPYLTLNDTNTGLRSILAGGNGDFGFYPASFIGGAPAVLIKNGTGDVGITGNATQSLDKGGFVKAMVYVNGDGNIIRCYNGRTGSSSGNCGFSVTRLDSGAYVIDFNFQVNDRFLSVSAESLTPAYCRYVFGADNDRIEVVTSNSQGIDSDRPVMVIVY